MTTTETQPENGARHSTPDGDNLLLDFARADTATFGAITRSSGGVTAQIEGLGLHLHDTGSPTPYGNIAGLTSPLSAADTLRAIEALREFYGARPGGPYFLFSPWPTEDLAGHGLDLVGHPPFMVRPAGGSLPAVPGLDVVEVSTETQLVDFERTALEAYPVPELLPFGSHPRWLGPDVIGSDVHLYVGYEDGRPVATAIGSVTDAIVAVEVVSTRPECRGRGYGAAITAAATMAAPHLPAALVSSDLGRPVYEGLGYLPVHRYTLWMGLR